MNEQRRIVGKIIKVSPDGWGFLSSRDIEFTRIFFHWTALKQDTLTFKELKTGMKVEFTPVQIEGRGWRAIQLKILIDPMRVNNEPPNEMPILQQ